MPRGVSFVTDFRLSFFTNLRNLMDISQYDWYVDDVDFNEAHFPSGKYSGAEFSASLDTIDNLSFVRIQRYPVGAAIDRIDKYEDFLKSSCDFFILYYDGGFCEAYAKDIVLVHKLYKFCQDSKVERFSYLQDENPERNVMHFW